MGDVFRGINGDFNGFALENSDFDPMSDDSDIDSFFDGDNGSGVIDTKTIKKGRIKRIKKEKLTKFMKQNNVGAFGGF